MNKVISNQNGFNSKDGQISVKCVKIDELISEADIMKIDVEGYEIPSLNGAKKLLENTRLNVIIIEAFNDKDIISLLRKYGFAQYGYK